jgi:hypothetical protein
MQRRNFIALGGSVTVGILTAGCSGNDTPDLVIDNNWDPGIRFTVRIDYADGVESVEKTGTIPTVEGEDSQLVYEGVFQDEGSYQIEASARDQSAERQVEHPGNGHIVVSLNPSKVRIFWVGPD